MSHCKKMMARIYALCIYIQLVVSMCAFMGVYMTEMETEAVCAHSRMPSDL